MEHRSRSPHAAPSPSPKPRPERPATPSQVNYATAGWVEKNRDPLSPALLEVVRARADALRAAWLPAAAAAAPRAPSALLAAAAAPAAAEGVGRKAASVAERYRAHLKELLAELAPARRHAFCLKCVKPNAELRPRAPQPAAVLRQLRRQGVLQARPPPISPTLHTLLASRAAASTTAPSSSP